MRVVRHILPLLVTLLCARPLLAQPAAPQPAGSSTVESADATSAAEDAGALFDRGLQAMMAERYAEGCPLLARSYGIEPLAGAEFTLAECLAKWGKTASALERYQGYLLKVDSMSADELGAQAERVAVARAQVPELEKTVPTLRLSLPPEAPAGTNVELDGVRVLYPGTRQKVDPGEHRAVVTLPSGETQEKSFEIAPAARAEIQLELPQGALAPGGDDDTDGDTMRTTGLVVGGVGVATVAVSLILGGVALGEKGTIDDNCQDHVCNATGKDSADSAQGLATGSTVTFIIGLVAVAAGTTLYLLAPDDDASAEADGDEEREPGGVDAEVVVGGAAHDPLSGSLGLRLRW